jgi:hypothetical protein
MLECPAIDSRCFAVLHANAIRVFARPAPHADIANAAEAAHSAAAGIHAAAETPAAAHQAAASFATAAAATTATAWMSNCSCRNHRSACKGANHYFTDHVDLRFSLA